MHGNQAGDPAKAATAIIAAVESSEPPAFLLLGPDALAAYRYIASAPHERDRDMGIPHHQHQSRLLNAPNRSASAREHRLPLTCVSPEASHHDCRATWRDAVPHRRRGTRLDGSVL